MIRTSHLILGIHDNHMRLRSNCVAKRVNEIVRGHRMSFGSAFCDMRYTKCMARTFWDREDLPIGAGLTVQHAPVGTLQLMIACLNLYARVK